MTPKPIDSPYKLLALAFGQTALILFVVISTVNAGGFLEALSWAVLGLILFAECFNRLAFKAIRKFASQFPPQKKVGWDEAALRDALHTDRMDTLRRGHDWDVADVMDVLIKQGTRK